MYVPDPVQAIAQLYQRLRPGGRVALSVWGERRNCGWASLFGIVDARVASDVCPMFFAMGAPNVLTGTMSDQGFVDVVEERICVTLDFATDEAALSAAFAGGPVALAYARFDDETKASAHSEYLDSIAQYRRSDGYRVPGEFAIATGRKP
jgi:SAM-dependent methyltransferase